MKFLSCIFCRISGFFDNRISSRISGLPYPVSGLKPSIKRADYLAGYSMLLLAAETQYFWYAIPGKKFEIPGKMFEISGKKF